MVAAGVVAEIGMRADVEAEVAAAEFGSLDLDDVVVGTAARDDVVSTMLVSAPRHNVEQVEGVRE